MYDCVVTHLGNIQNLFIETDSKNLLMRTASSVNQVLFAVVC